MKNVTSLSVLLVVLALTFIGCDPEPASQKSVFVPEVQEQVDRLDLNKREIYVTGDEGQTFMVNEEQQIVTSSIPCTGARCCKYTYTEQGVTKVKYYSFPACPTDPAFKDVGPCPVCPPPTK